MTEIADRAIIAATILTREPGITVSVRISSNYARLWTRAKQGVKALALLNGAGAALSGGTYEITPTGKLIVKYQNES